ncbi:hypothetical protein KSZ_44730 [Dictyobacter formicarum]|uniref:Uncharacterized protein n=1 Tax=Dictyobacter formicarum TaxID=2778368 RepID=A0ABQ3VKM8_9CHLR|nr:hypothetical protein KSZ_44730 [Dictyobacter formicarum]
MKETIKKVRPVLLCDTWTIILYSYAFLSMAFNVDVPANPCGIFQSILDEVCKHERKILVIASH